MNWRTESKKKKKIKSFILIARIYLYLYYNTVVIYFLLAFVFSRLPHPRQIPSLTWSRHISLLRCHSQCIGQWVSKMTIWSNHHSWSLLSLAFFGNEAPYSRSKILTLREIRMNNFLSTGAVFRVVRRSAITQRAGPPEMIIGPRAACPSQPLARFYFFPSCAAFSRNNTVITAFISPQFARQLLTIVSPIENRVAVWMIEGSFRIS